MSMKDFLKVLVIDDSAFIRQFLTNLFAQTPDLKVTATARDPLRALEILRNSDFDVIILDVEMPNMDGLDFLRFLMRFNPKPVVMISSWTSKNSDGALKALSLGAVDFVAKPTIDLRSGMNELKKEIITKVRTAAQAKVHKISLVQGSPLLSQPTRQLRITTDKVIAIGASTGGTVAITEILKKIHPQSPGIIILQHLPGIFASSFISSLQQVSRIRIKEAENGDPIISGQALLVSGGKNLRVKRSGAKYLAEIGPPLDNSIYNPSIDHTFFSVAEAAGENAMGIVLTGMGSDGAEGLKAMRLAGAYTIAQDEKTSVIYGMPQKAWELKAAIKQVPLDQIASEVHSWAGLL